MGKAREEQLRQIEAMNKLGRPMNVPGLPLAVVELDLEGEGSAFHIVLGTPKAEFREGHHPKPTIVISGKDEAWTRVLTGQVDITHPLARGQLKLEKGNFLDILNLARALSVVPSSKS